MKVAVIGGGPAGCMAAIAARDNGHDVILIERNGKIGRKLYISGKGRCNLTNAADYKAFLSNVVSNPKFPMSALRGFDSEDVTAFFEEAGVPLKVERGNRVFPVSDRSSDVIDALLSNLRKRNVQIKFDTAVQSLIINDGLIAEVVTDKGKIAVDAVIVATGGASYPLTGSDGNGYALMESLGHTIIPPVAALSAIELKGVKDVFGKLRPISDLPLPEGLSLKNVTLTAFNNGKKICSEFGEMLFTDNGVSGPIALTISSYINRIANDSLTFVLDLKPAIDLAELDKRLINEFSASNKIFRNVLSDFLPRSLIAYFTAIGGIPGEKQVNTITKDERKRLAVLLKGMTFVCDSLAPIAEAIVTAGGVNVKEIDPSTMKSRLIPNLAVAGELLDIDAFTGGFNIQLAFSTGYAAGKHI